MILTLRRAFSTSGLAAGTYKTTLNNVEESAKEQ